MPTIQDDKSAFEYTFRKDKKPGLVQLTVNTWDLMKFNETELHFKMAKFNEQNQFKFSQIVAVSGKFLFFW